MGVHSSAAQNEASAAGGNSIGAGGSTDSDSAGAPSAAHAAGHGATGSALEQQLAGLAAQLAITIQLVTRAFEKGAPNAAGEPPSPAAAAPEEDHRHRKPKKSLRQKLKRIVRSCKRFRSE